MCYASPDSVTVNVRINATIFSPSGRAASIRQLHKQIEHGLETRKIQNTNVSADEYIYLSYVLIFFILGF